VYLSSYKVFGKANSAIEKSWLHRRLKRLSIYDQLVWNARTDATCSMETTWRRSSIQIEAGPTSEGR